MSKNELCISQNMRTVKKSLQDINAKKKEVSNVLQNQKEEHTPAYTHWREEGRERERKFESFQYLAICLQFSVHKMTVELC